ncbi:signal peptidase II [candidate division KSB1 bacterium]|nr:signal peptidase II [candidate division KSB1 bacterium]
MRSYRILWVALFIFSLDQLTKWIIRQNMQLLDRVRILGDFFRLTYVENRGMAFGIQVSNQLFFTLFAVVASLVILVYLLRLKGDQAWPRYAMILILGGAIGNLFDRITRGRVVDFLDFEFFDIHIPAFHFLFVDFPGFDMDRWPIFNVADISVTIGMIMLLIYILFLEPSDTEEPANVSDSETIR